MSIKFLVLGGYFGFWVGGECRFYFYGRKDISDILRTETLLIAGNAFNCNGFPYGFTCRVSRGAPEKWPKYRTPARVRYGFILVLLYSLFRFSSFTLS